MGTIQRIISRIVAVFGVLLAIFYLFLPVYAFIPNLVERAIHLGLVIPLVFLAGKKPPGKGELFLNTLISVLGLFLCLYIVIGFEEVLEQYGIVNNQSQVIMGGLMVL